MTYLFCATVTILAYALFGYGLIIQVAAAVRGKIAPTPPAEPLHVAIVIAARNEERHIAGRVKNALEQNVEPHRLDVFVVSDGSTDATAERARHAAATVIELAQHSGKAEALNAALDALPSRIDVVCFTDANTHFEPGAVLHLLSHFGDNGVVGTCGQLTVSNRRQSWIGAAEALYWAYDNWLKSAENSMAGAVSAQGGIYALRRRGVAKVPLGVADDAYLSLNARKLLKGRLVYEPKALAKEAVSVKIASELGRRIRSTEQGWRTLLLLKELLNPIRYPLFSLQLWSHKVLRRLIPVLLISLFLSSIASLHDGNIYAYATYAQTALYCLMLSPIVLPPLRRLPGAKVGTFFLMGQYAMLIGMIRALLLKPSGAWSPVR